MAGIGPGIMPYAGHTGPVRSVAYAPDGATLATGGDDGTVRIWDARTGDQQRQLAGHTGPVLSVAYAPDGATLATGGHEGIVRIWDARTGDQQRQLAAHAGPVRSVAYAPDGATLATGGHEGTVIWDARTGDQQRQLAGHAGLVWSVAYAPDGATLATGGDEGSVRIWDARTGDQQRQLAGHAGAVLSAAYAPDGATLATAGEDGTVRIWDARTGDQQRQLAGHTGPVLAMVYAPDGTTLASVGDTTIRIWNPRNGMQIAGTGLGTLPRTGRPLAGVRSDAPSAEDQIGATSDVETLADLIAATATSPPLAIALIGDWGAGKSSVMLQIQRRIDVLAEMSRNNPGLSAFAANVRQVRFNAWDYSDRQLWSGLADHLFTALAADPDSTPSLPDPATARTERDALRTKLAGLEAEEQRLSRELSTADQAHRPQGFLAWLGSPAYTWRIMAAAARELALDIRGALGILLGWAVLGTAAYGAWALWGSQIGKAAAAAAAVLAPAVVIGQRLRAWHRAGTGITGRLRRSLGGRQVIISRQIADLRKRLDIIDASARLSAFLSDRGAPGAYQQYRGLLGQVGRDLATLSGYLSDARAEWLASTATTPPPLDRIVLYIDDLDRCPPRRVVEVLEAVHLMLALELFVVVVAVDARWLIRSLEYHYRELFGTGGTPVLPAPASPAEPDTDPGPASPVDYLEKIFQIPYALTPPPPAAMASYLRSLLRQPSQSADAPQVGLADSAPDSGAGAHGADDGASSEPDTPLVAEDLSHDDEAAIRMPFPDDARLRTGHQGDAIPDLRPLGLQLSRREIEFMARLGPLLPTPRAAKRLVNLYRLVRIGIPDSQLAAFSGTEAGGPYQAVQILLAVLVGSPAAAQLIFGDLMTAPSGNDIITIFTSAARAHAADGHRCARIAAALAAIAEDTPLLTDPEEYKHWCPTLARYSFHTRTMTAQLPPSDAPSGHDGRPGRKSRSRKPAEAAASKVPGTGPNWPSAAKTLP